jgi:predicted nucleotidyltransferase
MKNTVRVNVGDSTYLPSRLDFETHPMINSSLVLPQNQLAEFCRRHQVKRLSLFGSAARDDFRPDSDVDFLVEFMEGAEVGLFEMVEMREELSVLLGNRPVDLATIGILENPYRRKSILRDLEPVYVAQ